MSEGSMKRGGLCINCDNRHGCRTAAPLCASLTVKNAERWLAGKELMRQRGLLGKCRGCGHFRQCWGEEAYRRALAVDSPPRRAR